ncbi:hypothetical protein OE88DRAFT_1669129 [Heliocybe sulcata]|uniref:BTB domain-containing protein n=1 Tax=Heliocybe sulcata TaxID=5364 RepID=A0A5C3MLI7_9AGAM|nr:hypothetical protein OE88DRAFT_1669129 [Heliocybe sulcata]
MNFLGETATIVCTYNLRLDAYGKLSGTDGTLKPFFSDASALGWRLGAMTRTTSTRMSRNRARPSYRTDNYLDVYIDPSGVQSSLGPLKINVDVKIQRSSSSGFTPSDNWINVESEIDLHLPACTMEIGSWHMEGSISDLNVTIRCSVTLAGLTSTVAPATPSVGSWIQKSLENSIQTGRFTDTRFFVFSHRRTSGGADRPVAVFANSSALVDRCSYFQTLLSVKGFMESEEGTLDSGFPAAEGTFIEEYDYASDSDLEDDPTEDDLSSEVEGSPVALSSTEDVNEPKHAEKHEDTDQLEEGCELKEREDSTTDEIPVTETGASSSEEVPNVDSCWKSAASPTIAVGRTVVVKDAALRTFTSLIHYLYTGNINFAPLSSQREEPKNGGPESDLKVHAPSCSPKSMYRLADKLDLQPLKNMAFEALRSSLSKKNIVEETFSKFTWLHEEVRDMEIQALCKLWKSEDGEDVMKKVQARMACAPPEDLRRSKELVSLLLPRLVPNEGSAAISVNPGPSLSQPSGSTGTFGFGGFSR